MRTRKALLSLLAIVATGCATLSGSQPVQVVCASCLMLNATGLCAQAARCVPPSRAFITNYGDVLQHGADPKVECRE